VGGDSICIRLSKEDVDKLFPHLQKQGWVKKLRHVNSSLCFNVDRAEKIIPKLISLSEKIRVKIDSVETHKPTLEDVFIHYTGRKIREEEADEADRWRNVAMRGFRR